MGHSAKVPKNMQSLYQSITELTDQFCQSHLNEEYRQLAQYAAAALCRKRPSPLTSGRLNTWACAIITALGTVNFLYDKATKPYISAQDLAKAFNISKSTAGNKAKQIREWLKMYQLDHTWALPSKIKNNPLVWMITVDGFIMDARTLPVEMQEMAYQKGLIPYVHAHK